MLPYNYCGPWISDGKIQSSVVGSAPALSTLDAVCRKHDAAYAVGDDLKEADYTFAREARLLGLSGILMASAVGLQGLLRSSDKQYDITDTSLPQTMKRSLRTSHTSLGPAGTQVKDKAIPTMERINAPVSVGSVIRANAPSIKRTTDTAIINGHDFVGTVEGTGVTTFSLGKSALLSPAYFASSMLGATAATFEEYKWNRLRIHYIPRVATSAAGQVILTSQRSASEVGLTPESGTFLQRAMTQGNATFGPLWVPNYIDIKPSGWHVLDPATHSDLDDAIAEELLVYTQVATTGQVGYLWAEYEVAFRGALYQPHHSVFPMPTGPGLRTFFSDVNAINATTDDVLLTNTDSGLYNLASTYPGAIYRLTLDVQESVAPTGTTLANVFKVQSAFRSNTTTFSSNTASIPLSGGMVFYGTYQTANNWSLFSTLEGAISGSNGQVFYNTATTAVGTYAFDAQLVRYANQMILTTS